jgi:hypothetical protein
MMFLKIVEKEVVEVYENRLARQVFCASSTL